VDGTGESCNSIVIETPSPLWGARINSGVRQCLRVRGAEVPECRGNTSCNDRSRFAGVPDKWGFSEDWVRCNGLKTTARAFSRLGIDEYPQDVLCQLLKQFIVEKTLEKAHESA